METQKIINLLNNAEGEYSKFATKKWYVIDSDSKGNYSHENLIKFLTNSIESSLCDYSDAYILVTRDIRATPNNTATQVVFKQKYKKEIMKLLLMRQILLILQCLYTI